MPIYTYTCKSCNTSFEKFLKIADYMKPTMEPCEACNTSGNIEKYCDAPPLLDPTKLGRVKVDSDFRDVLKGVAKTTYKSDFNIR